MGELGGAWVECYHILEWEKLVSTLPPAISGREAGFSRRALSLGGLTDGPRAINSHSLEEVDFEILSPAILGDGGCILKEGGHCLCVVSGSFSALVGLSELRPGACIFWRALVKFLGVCSLLGKG